ncbi:twin-arginine translocase TatA/TatE family subunit [Streptomyces sp. NPDC057271]|uniref:twin-arginine translocase TatA/TatE family subunit n=1 Tax=unclassified Streptomyces TaxID=2593676 RepID=UPI00362F891A
MFGISEIAILLIVVILVFGARKLPELARNAGKAARILKSETKAMKTEGAPEQQATYQVAESRPAQYQAQDQAHARAHQGAPGLRRPDASPGPTTGNGRS